MPIITDNIFDTHRLLFNGHLQTIVPALFRKPVLLPFKRERISTPDDDFLDLDWLRQGAKKLIIISHGLEGNSLRPYMIGMAKEFFNKKYDVLTWNFRGCSGEINKKSIFYHSGATYDLDTVIQHAAKAYDEVNLIGFSLGGNLTLKYLGEYWPLHPKIRKATVISVPLHLESSSIKLSTGENRIYARRFLKTLKEKVIKKAVQFPDQINTMVLKQLKTVYDFDNHYTGPLHGFKNARDYYEKCSSLYFLKSIKTPTLIFNAQNDPFLSTQCFPVKMGKELENVYMEFPRFGGHVGFSPRGSKGIYWSEKRAFEFIDSEE
ncbi:MAG: alpha/beta fold hydrolase [Anditalea sp.]